MAALPPIEAMEKLIDRCDSDAWPALAALATLGLHHEQQHQELLLMDIKHVLFNNPVDPVYVEAPLASVPAARPLRMLAVARKSRSPILKNSASSPPGTDTAWKGW